MYKRHTFNYFEGEEDIEYERVDAQDVNGADILPYIKKVKILLLKSILRKLEKNILVHCFMGSSFVFAVIGYLMKNLILEEEMH